MAGVTQPSASAGLGSAASAAPTPSGGGGPAASIPLQQPVATLPGGAKTGMSNKTPFSPLHPPFSPTGPSGSAAQPRGQFSQPQIIFNSPFYPPIIPPQQYAQMFP